MCVVKNLPIGMSSAYLISCLQVATNNGVTIALPSIGKELDFDESKLQWLVSAYSLSSVCPRYVVEKEEKENIGPRQACKRRLYHGELDQ